MKTLESFSYPGNNVYLVQDSVIAFLAGGQVIIHDLDTAERKFISSENNGFTQLTSCFKRGLIAVAEYGLNPSLHIYNLEGLKPIHTISNICQLEVCKIIFSEDSKYIIICKGCPEYKISIADVSKEKILNGEELDYQVDIKNIIWHPQNSEIFCVQRDKNIKIYTKKNDFKRDEEAEKIRKNYYLDENIYDFYSDKQDSVITVMQWHYDGSIIIGGSCGVVIILNAENFQEKMRVNTYETGISYILQTIKYTIVVDKTWKLSFFLVNEETGLFVGEKAAKSFTFPHSNAKLKNIFYNQTYTYIIGSDENGYIYKIPIEAEFFEELNEDPDAGEDKNGDDVIKCDVETVLTGHTKEVAFLDIIAGNALLSVGHDGNIMVWGMNEKKNIAQYKSYSVFTCGVVSQIGRNIIYLGTSQGCIKIFDVSDFKYIRLIKVFKLNVKKSIKKIINNESGEYIIIILEGSKKLYLFSNKPTDKLTFYGYIKLSANILDICSVEVAKPPIESNKKLFFVEALLANALLLAITPNWSKLKLGLQTNEIAAELYSLYFRRVDPDLLLITAHPTNGDCYLIGMDKIIKKYKQPDEPISKLDLRIKAPPNPLDETEGHGLLCSTMKISQDNNSLITSGLEGLLMIRSFSNFANPTCIPVQSFEYKGASTFSQSRDGLIICGGKDGSIIIVGENWGYYNDKEDESKKIVHNTFDYETLDDKQDKEFKHQKEISLDEYNESQRPKREGIKKETRNTLKQISNKLHNLIQTNEKATPLEKLQRDEFCIDMEYKRTVLEEGYQTANEIKKNAFRENLRQEIYRNKIKALTWDRMEAHLKTVVGINQNIIVTNFHMRKLTIKEIKMLNYIRNFRKIEIEEQKWLSAHGKTELLTIKDLTELREPFIVNASSGKPRLTLIDFEKLLKVEEKDDAKAKKAGGLRAVRGIKEAVVEEKQTDLLSKLTKVEEETSEWMFLYGTFELFTLNRKKQQIYLIKNVIREIKSEFNKEFENILRARAKELDIILEKNNKIKEIAAQLNQNQDLFKSKTNLIETPQDLLSIQPGDIKIEKYLSKAERQKLNQERLLKEERLRLLNKDDAGVRALKQMMGGTLEEKKENKLAQELVREEWMNKPKEQMTEEEKGKYEDFLVLEAQLNEEKEKIKKGLEQEMRKLKNEILEHAENFDKVLMNLFIKRLEYEYRIGEQELYLTRINLSIMEEKFHNVELVKLEEKYKNLIDRQIKIDKTLQMLLSKKDAIANTKREYLTKIEGLESKVQASFEPLAPLFEEKKTKDIIEENKLLTNIIKSNPIYEKVIVDLDPFQDMNRAVIKKENEYVFETYEDTLLKKYKETPKINEIRNFFEWKKKEINLEQHSNTLAITHQKVSSEKANVVAEVEFCQSDIKDAQNYGKSFMSNIDILFRFKKGIVEIPLKDPVAKLNKAILIYRRIIQDNNQKIKQKALEKEEKLKAVLLNRYSLEKVFYDVKLLWLDIEDKVCVAKDITRLKVTKKVQVALAKKDPQMAEKEEGNIKKQLDSLATATEERVKALNEKEKAMRKEIEFLIKENERLNREGLKLEANLGQRKEISNMMGSKQNSSTDNTNAQNRFREIAYNRRLYDLAKKQAQEIELLMEELKRLKAKSFAILPNVPLV